MIKSLCSNCRNQMTGWDGGFFGEPVTCECRIYGETEGRKNCSKFKKRVTKSDLLNKIQSLEKENEQLRKQIQNYEQLISNSYVGEEETLDGFVGKYVIWENELQKYKNEMINNE